MRTTFAFRRARGVSATTRFLLLSLLAVLVVGCQQVQLAPGPQIPIPTAAAPVAGPMAVAPMGGSGIRVVSHEELAEPMGSSMQVEIVDQRPGWEKQFRSPAVKPSQYEHAYGFVALENLQPADQLQRTVQRAAARAGVNAPRAEIELRSFRIVVNDVEALGHDHRILKRVTGSPGLSLGPFKLGIGASISSDPIDTGPFADPVAMQRHTFRPALLRDGQKYLFGPPSQLDTRPYQAGVTCSIDATVTFIGQSGSRRTFLAQVSRHTPPADPTATSSHEDLVRTVADVHTDIENRLIGHIAHKRAQ